MPCAIAMGTYLAIARNTSKRLRFTSLNFPETADLHLQSSYSKTGPEWFNYPLGVLDYLLQNEHTISGLDLLFYGDLPIGAGLSSSASIEVLTGFAVNELFGLNISLKDIAILSKEAENRFVGVNCGIMDQFAVAMGKKDHAIWLDCDTLEYEYLPFRTGSFSLVIINCNKQRTLADSKYNERFAECGAALKLLKQELPVRSLSEVDLATFEVYRYLINNPVLEKRASHVISETQRVRDAVIALQTDDWKVFGQLMYASHESLRNLYEVSCRELDVIIDFCTTFPGCMGARMTGAGFGGCAIALVNTISLNEFGSLLLAYYRDEIGNEPGIIYSGAENGVRRIK